MYHPRSQLPALETRQGSHRGAVCRCRVHGPSSRSPNSGGVRLRLVTRDPAPAAPSGTFKPGSRFQQRLQQQLNDGQSWHEPGLVKVTRTQRGNHSYRSLHRKVCHHRTAAPRAPGTFYKKATNAEAGSPSSIVPAEPGIQLVGASCPLQHSSLACSKSDTQMQCQASQISFTFPSPFSFIKKTHISEHEKMPAGL